jgi:uncharacterized membrane protein YdjX (TVP38/TMEM64 family)
MHSRFDEPRPITTFQIIVFVAIGLAWAVAGLPALLGNRAYARIFPASVFGWVYALAGAALGTVLVFLGIRLYFSRKSSRRRRRVRTRSHRSTVGSHTNS